MKRSILFTLSCMATLVLSFGQSLKDTVKLKEVFVTSTRQVTERAFYINSIDSVVLINAINADLSDLLQKNSSLYIKSYGPGGLATASFRGTAASHTQVLWNGLNLNSPLWGQSDLSLLPVFFYDGISLLYGSSSLAKTSGGLGGCVSLDNTPVWNKGAQFSFSQTIGSFGYLLSQLKLGYSRDRFVSNTRIYLDKAKNDFRYYDNASGLFDHPRQENADYAKKGFLQEFYYKLNSRQFAGIKVMDIWSDRNLPPIMGFSGAERYENQKDNLLNFLGEWKYYGAKSNWSLISGLIRSDLGYFLSSTNPGGTFVNFDTKTVSNVFSNKLNFQRNFSQKTVLKSSFDAIFTEASYSDLKENAGFDVSRTDLTLQSSLHHVFSQPFSGYILAHQKLLDGDLKPFIAAAGLEYHVPGTEDLIFRTNFGRNLHVPNLNDMYFRPGGNLNLKPEIGYQADAGILWNRNYDDIFYRVEITGFTAWVDNWILWHPSEYRYWTADNVKQVFSRGIEIITSIEGSLGTLDYQFKGNYGFTRTTDQDKESASFGNQLIYIPRHIGNIQLYLEKETYSAVLSSHNTGSRYTSTIEDTDYRLPTYFLLDLGFGKIFRYKQHSIKLNFRLNNLLNKQYQVIEYRAMPGRNFSVSLNLSLNEV